MTQSPLYQRFDEAGALMMPYGSGGDETAVVGALDEVGLEYAALRKSCILFDMPHRGTISVRGSDRLEFLNNMITQKTIDLEPGLSRWSFWLSKKGRVDADLRLMAREDELLIRLDRHIASAVTESLNGYLFSEDVELTDQSDRLHRMSLHGPGSMAALIAIGAPEDIASMPLGINAEIQIDGHRVIVDRDDLTGEIGLDLLVERDAAPAVFDLLTSGENPPAQPAGWFSVNIARIEAGRPLFNIDFGTDNLPAETGVIDTRVDFKKGCYLGQEVVARMDARKARKQCCVGFRIAAPKIGEFAPMPNAGEHVYAADDPSGSPIGVVTSSTISPMLGADAIGFAMLRDKHTAAGTELVMRVENNPACATVLDSLRSWP